MKRLTQKAWDDIARAYAAGSETITAIAARHKISVSTVRKRAAAQGWSRAEAVRTGDLDACATCPKAPASGEVSGGGTASSATAAPTTSKQRQALVRRLYRAIDAKLRQMEKQMNSDEPISSADMERDTRALGVLITNFEKVTEFEADIDTKPGDKGGKQPRADSHSASASADAERMREEIARRLERLHIPRDAARGTDRSQP